MSRFRTSAPLLLVAVLATGCGQALSSMTQHWFYGYVVSAGEQELCLSDARTEDPEAERCFVVDGANPGDVAEGDLVKVRYERDGDGHGGGTVVEVRTVRAAQSDG